MLTEAAGPLAPGWTSELALDFLSKLLLLLPCVLKHAVTETLPGLTPFPMPWSGGFGRLQAEACTCPDVVCSSCHIGCCGAAGSYRFFGGICAAATVQPSNVLISSCHSSYKQLIPCKPTVLLIPLNPRENRPTVSLLLGLGTVAWLVCIVVLSFQVFVCNVSQTRTLPVLWVCKSRVARPSGSVGKLLKGCWLAAGSRAMTARSTSLLLIAALLVSAVLGEASLPYLVLPDLPALLSAESMNETHLTNSSPTSWSTLCNAQQTVTGWLACVLLHDT